MRETRRSRGKDFLTGALAGFLAGLIVVDLDLTSIVSYWGERSVLVPIAVLVTAVSWPTSLRKLFAPVVAALAVLWLAVTFTPLTHWMAQGLSRKESPRRADAVFVLASKLQGDGDLTTDSMSRLIRGLELLGDAWAPRLILSELPSGPRYRNAACELMESLGLEHEIITVGPTRNTHDEAVAVGEIFRDWGFARILVVTSPSHSRRAAAALEAEGVVVTSVPSERVDFDFEKLRDWDAGDSHRRAFPRLLHEHVGLLYYRWRGWIR